MAIGSRDPALEADLKIEPKLETISSRQEQLRAHRPPDVRVHLLGVDLPDVPGENLADGVEGVLPLACRQGAVEHGLWHWDLQSHILKLNK